MAYYYIASIVNYPIRPHGDTGFTNLNGGALVGHFKFFNIPHNFLLSKHKSGLLLARLALKRPVSVIDLC